MKPFNILALGDICGPEATKFLCKRLWSIRRQYGVSMVVANAENCAEPNGIDKDSAISLFESGVDVITTGNHVYRKSSVFSYLDDEKNLLRPLNFPSTNPGHGSVIAKIDGVRVLCMNVLGDAYMDPSGCPFDAVERELDRQVGNYDFALLDIHAEATGEKKAIAYNFSDRISVCFGTHTHVQTSDAQVLDGKCAYLTDLGMCGAVDSVLGVKKEAVIHKMKTKMLSRFDFAGGEMCIEGAIFSVNTDTWHGISCKNIRITGELK
ncbi:MAG: YmdB family metallophosphoesterase [Clostridia bacterium]|nr:YmdB family metallophosphoesterase [Clostridia bacterium]